MCVSGSVCVYSEEGSVCTFSVCLRPEEDQSIWLKRWQGFQPCCEAGIREPTLSVCV